MGLLNIFKKKEKITPLPSLSDLSWIGTDMHSHLLFDLDDGAQTKEDTLSLLNSFVTLGYKKIITTPHTNEDPFPNTKERILSRYEAVKALIEEAKLPIELKVASEYMVDPLFMKQLNNNEEFLCVSENKILIEMSYMHESPYIDEAIFLLQSKGYDPILAHPERYLFYGNQLDNYQKYIDRGVALQLNTNSVTGYYGKQVKDVAMLLLANNMYDYIGTDAHHQRHVSQLELLLSLPEAHILKAYPFKNATL